MYIYSLLCVCNSLQNPDPNMHADIYNIHTNIYNMLKGWNWKRTRPREGFRDVIGSGWVGGSAKIIGSG